MGERFTPTHRIREYARLLASLSPRVRYEEYGRTPERRELFHLIVSSEANLAASDSIAAAHAELANPETPRARSEEVAATLPAVVYFTFGIHGNEASASEAAMWTAWELARAAQENATLLDSLVVVLDPLANPDGRERYVQWYRSVVGERPNPDPRSREHREPWPGGRTNHYLLDLNRDWAWGTQVETQARLEAWHRWNPLVHVDFHEMHFESSYFFFPPADPVHPAYPRHVLGWAERFGAANAAAFDRHGWPYFTGDAYDLFYPGYGDSWPGLLGAVGMTYEQAGGGSAGLAVLREQGDTLTLNDRIQRHVEAGMTTLRAAAAGRAALISGFAEAQRRSGEGEQDLVLVPGADASRLAALVAHLRSQGILVDRYESAFRAQATPHPGFAIRDEFPAGTHRVRARQPRGRLATALLAPAATAREENSYDIGAWSLPYAYGVEAHRVEGAAAILAEAGEKEEGAEPAAPLLDEVGYGYLIPGTLATAPAVVRLLSRGVRMRVLSRPARLEGRWWRAGTWFVPLHGNPDASSAMRDAGLAESAVSISGGRAEAGVDLGSAHVWPVEMPRVGVLSGEGVAPGSFGAHWFFLEARLGMAFDALLLTELPELDLNAYQVLVLPDLSGAGLSPAAATALRYWVEQGGRLVAVSGGAAAVAPTFDVPVRAPLGDEPDGADQRLLRTRSERRSAERQDAVTGVILPLSVDSIHPFGWGWPVDSAAPATFVLHTSPTVFEPAPGGEVIAFFPDSLDALGGTISGRNLDRLERAAWLLSRPYGRGSVTLFADDPLFRLFWQQTHLPYLRALLIGPRR